MATKQINQQAELPDTPQADDGLDEGMQTVGTNNDERLAFMDRLNDQVDAARADELADVHDDGTTTAFTADNAPAEGQAPVEAAPPQAPAEDAELTLPTRFKIKVNGKEIELTQDELIVRAQKVEAADAYLAEAARMRKEQQEAVTQRQQQPSPEDVAAAAEEEDRAVVRAIQMGTEDEAIAAIRKLKSKGPSVTTDDIARTIDDRLTFKEAARQFQTDYKDIMDEPVLRKMALQKDQELLSAGDKRDYAERYKAIGNDLREWRDNLIKANAPAVVPVTTPAVETKQLRKAAAASVPVTASKRAPTSTAEDEKEESVADIIANIAKARGGPQWART